MFPTCVAKPGTLGGQVPPRGARLPSPSAAGAAAARWGRGRNRPAPQNGRSERKTSRRKRVRGGEWPAPGFSGGFFFHDSRFF